jgi:DNA-directed RNA polymerase specialized sigma24 family protein
MGSAWRPTPAERAALSTAVWRLSIPDWVHRDDIRQAGLIWLWRNHPTIQDRSYLLACLRHACLDELRRQMGRYAHSHMPHASFPDDQQACRETPESYLRLRDMLRVLGALPAPQREAVALMLDADERDGLCTRREVHMARQALEAVL